MLGPTHVVVTPSGSEVMVFLKVWMMGKIIAILWSMKFRSSGINGDGDEDGDSGMIWEVTVRVHRIIGGMKKINIVAV